VTGQEVISPIYDEVRMFSYGLAAVRLDGKWGFIDTTGQEVISLVYDNAKRFSDGLAAVNNNGKWGFIDVTGREVVPLIYTYVWAFHDGLARAYYGGYLDIIAPCNSRHVFPHSGEWRILDTNGNVVAVLDYNYVGRISNGIAAVQPYGGWVGYRYLIESWGFVRIGI